MSNKSTQAISSPVVEMLKADHEKVKALFEEYKEADSRRKQEIAKTAIQELEEIGNMDNSSCFIPGC